MKLIKQILFSTFLLLYLLLLAEEVAMFGVSMFIYKDPINNTREQTDSISFQANLDSAAMLKKSLIRKFNHITTDLIYTGKHMKHFLTSSKNEPSINENSAFYKKYLDDSNNSTKLVIESELTNNNDIQNIYNNTSENYNYIDYFSEKIPRGTEEDNIINTLFDEEVLNKISRSTAKNKPIHDYIENKVIPIYAISMFKSIFIKNFIIEHSAMTMRRFILFAEKYAYIYPPETMSNTYIGEMISNCGDGKIDENWICIPKIFLDKDNESQDIVYFTQPKLDKGSIILEACIKLPEISTDVTNPFIPVICSDIDLSYYLRNYIYNKDTIQLGLFNYNQKDTNSLKIFFTNEPGLTGDIKSVFGFDHFENYKLSDLLTESDKFTLFHLLYYSFYYKINNRDKTESELIIPEVADIIKEYNEIQNKIIEEIIILETLFDQRTKNQCDYKDLYHLMRNFSMKRTFYSDEDTKVFISYDYYQFIIAPIVIDFPGIDPKTYLSSYPDCASKILFYSVTAVKYIPETRSNWLLDILLYKIIKLSLFFFVLLTALTFALYLITQLYVRFILRSIFNIKKEIDNFNDILEDDDTNSNDQTKQIGTTKKLALNIETSNLEGIFEMMKNIIIVKKTLSNLDFENQRDSYEQLVNNINDRDVKEVCMLILGYSNFKQNKYNQSIYNFNFILEGLQIKETTILNSNEQLDSQIKEILKRSADVSYINYFTSFQGNNETILPLLKIRQLSQEIHYLCGLSLLRGSKESKEFKQSTSLVRQDPIDYFIKARDINHNLEINSIKELFNMIMISRCYIQMGEFNKSMQNLSEALLLFNDLQKKLNVNVNKDIDPKVLLFANNAIFHSIMLEIASTAYQNQMYYFAGWVVNKIFDTSIFLINPVHLSASNLMIDILKKILHLFDEKKKNSFNKLTEKKKAFFEDKKRFYEKISIRLTRKNKNKPNKKDKKKNKEKTPQPDTTDTSLFNEIILCISEKIFKIFNGPELKDIVLKYLLKNFLSEDLFSYIQFAPDGKRTFSIVSEKLKQFTEKLKNEKSIFKQSELNTMQSNDNQKFTGFFSILEAATKCIEFPKQGDNMIFMFINAKDIRFTDKKQCSDIVKQLNESNCSLILFSFDDDLSDQKIEKIKAFVSCLIEGVFVQVKNYRVIKQVFQSLGSIQRYYSINDFSFENIDCII